MSTKKQEALLNLRKARGLLEKVISMAEKDRYCVEIMQQNLALIGILKSAHQMLMENHLNSCFREAVSSPDEAKKSLMIREILKVTKLANK